MTVGTIHATTLSMVLLAAGLLVTVLPDTARQRMRRVVPGRTAGSARRDRLRGLGRFAPNTRGMRRTRDVDAEAFRLAAAWDLLAASLHAGMPVPDAVRAIAGNTPVRVEQVLLRTADLLALGADPVQAWAWARECPDTTELARAACRTARSGTALAEVAASMAERVRAHTADKAQAHAQRAAVLITGPLGLCFLPAFICLGVIPVVLGLAGRLTVL